MLREGDDITIITYGISINEALDAADRLEEDGISAEIIKLGCIQPIDFTDIEASACKTGRVIVLEECAQTGCAGQRILAYLTQRGVTLKSARLMNLGDRFIPHGTPEELRRLYEIDAAALYEAAMELRCPKTRLDALLTVRGLFESRARAAAAIKVGRVTVDGNTVTKAGAFVDGDCEIAVTQTSDYASRGALKLEKALDTFGVNPTGRVCIDCGASTGGFTDCLLRRGAEKVYAVDVGSGQLIERLREDARVVVMGAHERAI